MIFLHRLDKEWYKDDTPQLWEGVVDNPGELASWDDLEYCMNNPQSYQIIFLEKDSGEPFTLNEYPRSWSHDSADVSEVFKAFKEGHNIIIYTDSKYTIQCSGEYGEKCEKSNWKNSKGYIINHDLVKVLYSLCKQHDNVILKHVKGHSKDKDEFLSDGNKQAHILAYHSINK